MAQDNIISLKSKKAKGDVYYSRKNRKKLANAPKLALKKYSKTLKKHIVFGEGKK